MKTIPFTWDLQTAAKSNIQKIFTIQMSGMWILYTVWLMEEGKYVFTLSIFMRTWSIGWISTQKFAYTLHTYACSRILAYTIRKSPPSYSKRVQNCCFSFSWIAVWYIIKFQSNSVHIGEIYKLGWDFKLLFIQFQKKFHYSYCIWLCGCLCKITYFFLKLIFKVIFYILFTKWNAIS